MADAILRAHNLGYAYPKSRPLFRDVSIDIAAGKATAIIGPNGCGKSTLISVLAGIIRGDSGSISVEGTPVSRFRARDLARIIGVLPQRPEAAEGLTVRDLVALGRIPHRGFLSTWTRADEDEVAAALDAVGLEAFAGRALSSLSGGQRQRAFIAMVLAQQPRLLFLDEPTSYLDLAHQLRILRILEDLKSRRGMTIVAAVHDIAQAAWFADEIVVMKEGEIVASGPPEEVLDEALIAEVFEARVRIRRDAETGQLIVVPLGLVEKPSIVRAISA
ncbi:MAG: ABC transporter ATP-binding protein [Pseudomonadota bacterium]